MPAPRGRRGAGNGRESPRERSGGLRRESCQMAWGDSGGLRRRWAGWLFEAIEASGACDCCSGAHRRHRRATHLIRDIFEEDLHCNVLRAHRPALARGLASWIIREDCRFHREQSDHSCSRFLHQQSSRDQSMGNRMGVRATPASEILSAHLPNCGFPTHFLLYKFSASPTALEGGPN